MIDMEIHFRRTDLISAINVIFDKSSSGLQYSNDEDSHRNSIFVNTDWITALGKSGCFLWSKDCNFEIRIGNEEYFTIYATSENQYIINNIFNALIDFDILFGYACDAEERIHRNRVSREMDYGIHEAWVGRDYTRYIPGIYWLTLLPTSMLAERGITLDSLRQVAAEVSLHSTRTWLVRLYKNPIEWVDEATRIDNWCAQTSGCFSKAWAESGLARATNFIEASTSLSEWT